MARARHMAMLISSGEEIAIFSCAWKKKEFGFWCRIVSTTGGKLGLRLCVQWEEKWMLPEELAPEFVESWGGP